LKRHPQQVWLWQRLRHPLSLWRPQPGLAFAAGLHGIGISSRHGWSFSFRRPLSALAICAAGWIFQRLR
jgi:hypothetical protein